MYTSNSQDPNPIVQIETTDAIGLSVRNQPTKADYIFINDLVSARLNEGQAIPILVQIDTPSHVALDQLFKELHITFKHLQKEIKVAILARDGYPIDMKEVKNTELIVSRFSEDEKDQAIQWLKE